MIDGVDLVPADRIDPLDHAAERLVDPGGEVLDRPPEALLVTGPGERPRRPPEQDEEDRREDDEAPRAG